jgi:hypothetical protein
MLRAHSNYRPTPPSFHQHMAQAREIFFSPDPFHPSLFSHEDIDQSIRRQYIASSTLPPAPLEFGANGGEVAALQAVLHALGYYSNGSLDSCSEEGLFGDKTFASLAT